MLQCKMCNMSHFIMILLNILLTNRISKLLTNEGTHLMRLQWMDGWMKSLYNYISKAELFPLLSPPLSVCLPPRPSLPV